MSIGAWAENALNVVPEPDGSWRTYWRERFNEMELHHFADEHEAVCHLLGLIAFAQLHGGLLGTAERPGP